LIHALVLVALAAARADTYGIEDLREGLYIEVRGEFDQRGVFVGSEAELLEPDNDVIIGTVVEEPPRAGRFVLHGQEIAYSEKTDWENLRPEELHGSRIKVEGRYRGSRKFSAREIATRGKGRDRLGARIDAIHTAEGGVLLQLMRWDVFLPAGIKIESAKPPAELPLMPPRPVAPQDETTDEADIFGSGIGLPHDLTLYGQLELDTVYEDEFDLDDAVDRDRIDLSASARLRLLWEPTDRFTGMATVRASWLYRDDQDDDALTETDLMLGETWGWWRGVLGKDVDLIVGRQDFDDVREWIYDQDLDAVRFVVRKPWWRLDLSASTTYDGSPRDESATNMVAYLSNGDNQRHLAAYAVYRDIDEPVDEQPLHLGARAIGEWLPQNDVWADVSGLSGERADDRLNAYGLDLGTTWSPPALAPFSFTAGYAFASGDADPGGTDHGFRQTGFQDNTAKFAGVTSFQYYGELFDPELANMRILTAGVGARIATRTSLDLVWHQYQQDEPLASLIDAGVKPKPDGVDANLGTEVDLILGMRRFTDWDLEVVLGWFSPGDAFTQDDDALLGKIQLRYRL
jgi:alginate production protein